MTLTHDEEGRGVPSRHVFMFTARYITSSVEKSREPTRGFLLVGDKRRRFVPSFSFVTLSRTHVIFMLSVSRLAHRHERVKFI